MNTVSKIHDYPYKKTYTNVKLMEALLDHNISMIHPLGTMNVCAFSQTEDFEISSKHIKEDRELKILFLPRLC